MARKEPAGFHYSIGWVNLNNIISSRKAGQIDGLPMRINGVYTVRGITQQALSRGSPPDSYFIHIFIGFP